jgi:hypothetical protein
LVTSQKPRLVAEISEDTDRRLRLLVTLRKQPLARVLTDVLDGALPSRTELEGRTGAWLGGCTDEQR